MSSKGFGCLRRTIRNSSGRVVATGRILFATFLYASMSSVSCSCSASTDAVPLVGTHGRPSNVDDSCDEISRYSLPAKSSSGNSSGSACEASSYGRMMADWSNERNRAAIVSLSESNVGTESEEGNGSINNCSWFSASPRSPTDSSTLKNPYEAPPAPPPPSAATWVWSQE